MDSNDSKNNGLDSTSHKEPRCIFFLVPLIIGCTLVAAVTVEAVHYLIHAISGPMSQEWPLYLAVAVVVAAVIAGVRRFTHAHHAAHPHPTAAH
jgi:hypothetical protein